MWQCMQCFSHSLTCFVCFLAIVKPSEVAPETGAIVVNAVASALPPGVLQLAQGDGSVGSHLVSHPDIDMICMTGSSATGMFQPAK